MAHFMEEEFEDNDLFEVDDEHMAGVLSDPSHRMHLVNVSVPQELRPSLNHIFRRIKDLIVENPEMTPDAWNTVDSLPPARNESELRIVVKFLVKRDAELFQAMRTVDITENGVKRSIQIEQPRVAYEEEVPTDGKQTVVLKYVAVNCGFYLKRSKQFVSCCCKSSGHGHVLCRANAEDDTTSIASSSGLGNNIPTSSLDNKAPAATSTGLSPIVAKLHLEHV
ncbi:hypothetical protein R1sor_023670 [Riccia sorocarpa]|uniref:Uncharacterized protein n=1 Tax=Riccia sorocarpa TaxID=122646 RepID=A0ABD3GQL6_9MARC